MTFTEREMLSRQESHRKFVEQHVSNCVSYLITHLASSATALDDSGYNYEDDLLPILQHERWNWDEIAANHDDLPEDFEELYDDERIEWARDQGIDPDYPEAYEHWIVSGWLASRLKEKGEMVGEIFNLTIWGRTTTGQAILLDSVIQEIAEESRSLLEENRNKQNR